MSTLADYLAFAKAHPGLFVNPPHGGMTILLDEDEIRESCIVLGSLTSPGSMPDH